MSDSDCEFVGWYKDMTGKVHFATDADLPRLAKLKIKDEDIWGRGVIYALHGWAKDNAPARLQGHECTNFSSPSNFPPEIAEAIKAGHMTYGAAQPAMLSAAGSALYVKRQQAYDEWQQIYDKRQQVDDEWQQANDRRQQADDKWRQANAEWRQENNEWRQADDRRQQSYDKWQQAYDKRRQADNKWQQAYDKWRQIDAEWQQAYDKWQQVDAKRRQAYAKQQQAYAKIFWAVFKDPQNRIEAWRSGMAVALCEE